MKIENMFLRFSCISLFKHPWYFNFLKCFGIFYFCRNLVLKLQKMAFQWHTFQYLVCYGYIQTDSQIMRYISKFKNTFRQLWGYSCFNLKYLSHQFLQILSVESCRAALEILQMISQNLYIQLGRLQILTNEFITILLCSKNINNTHP